MPILLFCSMQFSIHKKFQLNDVSFLTKEGLLDYSKSISELIFSFLSDFLSSSETISVQTSGSTGKPKLIDIQTEFMVNSALATGKFFDLKENTTALLCMNPNFIAGKMMLVRAMTLGWKLDVVAPSLNPLEKINKTYDFCALVPLQVHHSLDELHKIKKLIVGGGAISKELETRLQTVKTEVFATYGMTETITHIAVKRVNGEKLKRNSRQYIPSSVVKRYFYKTLPNIKISKDNRDCLIIDASKVAKNKVVTNDLIDLISDTEFQWLGRYDNIINSGGVKLIPEQIEQKLANIIEQRFFVVGIKDAVLGEKLVLVVEGKGLSKQSIILNEVQHLSSLSKYEVPKEIYFADKFVETDTKKIQRKKTLELLF